MFSPKRFTLYFIAVLILSVIFLSTCSETSEYGEASDYEKLGAADTIVPNITLVSPTDNSSDVAVSTSIVVTFSEKISTSSATTNTSDTSCSGSFQLSSDNFSSCIKMSAAPLVSNSNKTFTLTPADNLSGRVTYQLKLTTSVKDANGVALETYTTNGFITYYDRFTSGSGVISGTTLKQSDDGALSGVGVEYNIGGYTKTVTSDSSGDYGIYSLTSGSYTLSYSKSSYKDETQGASLAADTDNITVATLRMVANGCSGGNISGSIRDAVSSDNVSGASISIRSGLNVRTGSTISGKTATTATNGTYSLSSVDAGSYTVEASKSGMHTSYFNVSSCSGKSNQNAYMRETLPDGAMSIVLTWNGTEDFDSHLEIPCTSGTCSGSGNSSAANRADKSHLWYGVSQSNTENFSGASSASTDNYHIYSDIVSSATNSSGDYVTLDVDNRAGILSDCSASGGASHGRCGPETITISKLRSGTYRYHVHAFSQKGVHAQYLAGTRATDTSHLADNGTFVQVFYGDASYNFYVPKRAGDVWTVFDFSLSDNFTQLNTMGSNNTPGNIDNIQ